MGNLLFQIFLWAHSNDFYRRFASEGSKNLRRRQFQRGSPTMPLWNPTGATAFSGFVVSHRMAFARTGHRYKVTARHAGTDQVIRHRVGAFFREFLVVGVLADAVGMPTDPQLGARGFLFQAGGDGVELGFVRRRQLGRVELEVYIANHDGFFLDHNHLFNHNGGWRRWATIGIDLHAFRRTGALVTAVRHAIAVFVAIAVYPAIGAGHAADQQRAVAGIG